MNEMIERMAAALKSANEEWARSAPMMDCFHMPSVYHYMAVAALEAMREPTDEMCRVAGLTQWSAGTYREMIRAALQHS